MASMISRRDRRLQSFFRNTKLLGSCAHYFLASIRQQMIHSDFYPWDSITLIKPHAVLSFNDLGYDIIKMIAIDE